MSNKREIIILAALSCALAAIPFLVVNFPPIIDLPQHVAQVRLFGEAISNPASPYRIQWITPYSLVYAVLGGNWLIFGPINAGRMGMLMIVVFWVIMLHLLSYKMKRPALAASLASILFFGHILYWGFYQFAFGWPLFIGWILLSKTEFQTRWKEGLVFFLASIILYMAHIFWFLVAVGWLVVRHLILKGDLKRLMIRVAAASPLILLGLVWYPSLGAYGFISQTIWATTPFERLFSAWLVDATFGGIKGSIEYIVFGLLIVWIVVACLQNRKDLLSKLDRELVVISALFMLLAFILPDKQTNTIRFCQRWVPPALAFLLIGLPSPRLKKSMLTGVVVVIVAGFLLLTSWQWIAFERTELSGLKESLAVLPQTPKVLGLSYIKDSPIVRGRPFIQTFAYSQVLKGGELNFSFADFGPSLVVYRERRLPPWTPELEWFPEKAKKSDLLFFDYALLNADEKLHAAASSNQVLKPLTKGGRWRCYKVGR